jgi:hypothetical protein
MSTLLKSQILTLFGTFSWIAGTALCGYAIYKLYAHTRDANAHTLESAGMTFFIGVALVSLNSVLKAMFATFGVTAVGISYSVGGSDNATVAAQLTALENLAYVVGVGFLIKGLLMLRRAQTPGQSRAGLVTLFAAVLVANPGWFAAKMLATLGGN